MSKKILLIDDSVSMVTMVKFALESAGHEVTVGYDGEEGLQKLNDSDGFDLMICDYNMPKLDGLGVLKEVRASAKHSSLPFMMLTTETQGNLRDEAKAAGANAWMIKPFTEDQIMEAVNRLVR